jgi:hypothetical protein
MKHGGTETRRRASTAVPHCYRTRQVRQDAKSAKEDGTINLFCWRTWRLGELGALLS